VNTIGNTGDYLVTVFDLTGRQVMNAVMKSGEQLEVRRGTLQSGNYIVRLIPVSGGNASHLRMTVY
jgi:hypothetical protein